MEFSRQEYLSGLLCPPPGDLPDPGIKTGSPAMQAKSLMSEPWEALTLGDGPKKNIAMTMSKGVLPMLASMSFISSSLTCEPTVSLGKSLSQPLST